MKKLLLLLGVLLLAACDVETREATSKYAMPEELQNCKMYHMQDSSGSVVVALVCPNSTTSTAVQRGKTKQYTVTYNQ